MEAFAPARKFHSIVRLTQPQPKSKPTPKPHSMFSNETPLIPLKLCCPKQTWPQSYACFCFNSDNAPVMGTHRTVRVKLILHKECQFGEEFSAVGEDEILGSWDPQSAIPMTWAPGHTWTTPSLDLPVGRRVCFKFILRDREGGILWQPGPDRVFHTWETRGTILVAQDWDEFDFQTIIDEETGEERQEEIAESGGDVIGGGGECSAVGDVPVLVSGLTTRADGDGSCSAVGEGPVLVPGLTTVADADGDCAEKEEVGWASHSPVAIMAAEEEEEEKEDGRSLYVENGYAFSNNHASCSGEEKALTSSNATDASVVCEEVISTSGSMELVENEDSAASSESSHNEGEDSDSVICEPDNSVLQKDFEWGRNALSKLIWSLGLKHE
uniref:TSA: Wollemia nobilis Ref_Wollemi_Transcript_8199_1649 transcribed RNA sequence n=1 Tax=Wollemia nobilis TaxID=56998 RepID=A0A0C9RWQ1_9CONI